MIKIKYVTKCINYNGSQLSPHFIFNNFNILGDAVISFQGKCNILPEFMIDLVDLKEKKKIYSENMLHFIGEFFSYDLEKTLFLQRLFISIIKDELIKETGKHTIIRIGDDIFDGNYKVSISVATISCISALIHIGINISSRNTPLPTKGLDDYNIQSEKFAKILLKKFSSELNSIYFARCKVKKAK